MVVVAQLVELQIVVLAVVGSSPIDHPPETVGFPTVFFILANGSKVIAEDW